MLAQIVKSIKKSFFFVRTKIDIDVWNNHQDNPKTSEDKTLEKIKKNCLKNLEGLESKDEDVFLISNRETTKWDFVLLEEAILDDLPTRQRESLTLTLNVMTNRSMDIVRQKVRILRGKADRICRS